MEQLVQFGVAGLMGALWVWERAHSRKRDAQIDEAHDRLMSQDRQLEALIGLVKQNTEALVAFERAQQRICQLLEGIAHERHTERSERRAG